MVIHHFNRIIRNKWIWGVFAFAISAFFAFDFLLTGSRDEGRASGIAGQLADKDVNLSTFRAMVEDLRGFGRSRDRDTPQHEINRSAWESLAALEVARSLHLTANDAEVREQISRDPSFRGQNGAFSFQQYQMLLRENGLTPEHFEEYLKRRITLAKLTRAVIGAAAWVSPAELDGAINDVTDKFTVRIASFNDKDAGKVKLSDADLENYYKDHTNSIALPDCMTVKYVAFKADDPARLATFKIPGDEVSNHWDVVQGEARFQVKKGSGTNTVVETMSLDKAYPIVEHDLQLIASLEAYRTNLLFRVYPADAKSDDKTDRLEEIAKAEKQQIKTSGMFSADGRYVAGFMVRPSSFAPGCPGFTAAAAELDPEANELRYGVVAGTNVVYLMERASFVKAHVPAFAEAKEIIRPDALKDARAKAFKASVEKNRALAAAAIAKGGQFDVKTVGCANVSTSLTFAVSSLGSNSFADSRYVASSVMKLSKGNISDFIPTAIPSRGLLVYVEDRVPGDAAQAQMLRNQLRDELASATSASLPVAWNSWNLARLGFKASASEASVEKPDEDSNSEE